MSINNHGEKDYQGKISQIAETLKTWQGPFVLMAHVDPDGDALGSSLSLKRALDDLGKETYLPLELPRYLEFLSKEGEFSEPLESLPENCMLVVLDVADEPRAAGAPFEGAAFTINIDHHGTNNRYGDLSCVEPSQASTAQIVKDIVDIFNNWTVDIATPCLTGILTDTGNFRHGNTTAKVLNDAGELIEKGVDLPALSDQLQMRHPDYYKMLGKVMSTVEYPLNGLVAMARLTQQMRDEVGPSDDDSDDFVGQIRYAEGIKLAVLLKEREESVTKVSMRSRNGFSAQNVCVALGGGGHVAAAGATIHANVEDARQKVIDAVQVELERNGYTF